MEFLKSLGWPELIAVMVFFLLYIIFIYKYFRISKDIKVNFYNLLGKLFLRTVYFLLIIISLLGPSFGEAKKEVKAIGKDIFICVDLSHSMNATDIEPSRLERMKFELKKIVNAFNTDKIGLIIFSSEAFVQCPPTFDQSALVLFIESLSTGLLPYSSTDFGPPLKMSLKKLTEGDTLGNKQSKVIVLVSDGEDFGDETMEVAEDIEDEGIKLFTLGIGTQTGSRIPLAGGGYKRDKKGNIVNTSLNSASLRKLAQETGGKYFEINEKENEVPRLIYAINQVEGEVKDVRKIDASANKYFYFLFAAFILMVFDAAINFKTVKL
ncbi:MAG TPA: VWA domain-containing protein [Cytophagales bacterium]|nr:VWA domain-containing protein [Cytophagales bacterium]